jgi:hypothetical protein
MVFSNLSGDRIESVNAGSGGVASDAGSIFDPDAQRLVWSWLTPQNESWSAFVVKTPVKIDEHGEPIESEVVVPTAELVHRASSSAPLLRWPLSLAYHRASADPSGRYVIFHNGSDVSFSAGIFWHGAESQPEGVFNRNLVEIVDTQEGKVLPLTLAGGGGQLYGARFPSERESSIPDGEFMLSGVKRRVAAFSSEGEMQLVDLYHPTLSPLVIALEPGYREPIGDLKLRPADALVADPLLLVQMRDRADLVALTLRPSLGSASDFRADYSLISTLAPALDFETVTIDGAAWIASATTLGLVLTNIASAETLVISECGAISQVEVGTSGDESMVYAWLQGGQALHRVDLTKVTSSIGRTPKTFDIRGGIVRASEARPGLWIAGASDTLFFADFLHDRLTPMAGLSPGTDQWQQVGPHLFIGSRASTRLSRIHLDSLVAETLVLEHPIESFEALENRGKFALLTKDSQASYHWAELSANALRLDELEETTIEWSQGASHE